jgi:hypothetical protein
MAPAKGLPLALILAIGSGTFATPVAAGSAERYACEDTCVANFANCFGQWTTKSSKEVGKDIPNVGSYAVQGRDEPCSSAHRYIVSLCITRCIKDNPDVSKRVPGPEFAHYLSSYCRKPIEDVFPNECK